MLALQNLAEDLETRASHAEAQDKKEGRDAWKLWVESALSGGGKKAHKWVKGPHPWVPHEVIIDGVARVTPQAQLQAELLRCTSLWTKSSTETARLPLLPPAERSALPRLTPKQIQTAGLASAASKATTYDGFHPRHIAHLCEEGRLVVAMVWEACELSGLVPPQIHDITAPLIPKKNWKLRDLGLFPGFIRVCAKARSEFCRKWEAENDRSFFASGAARATTDTVWRAAVRAEADHASNLAAAAVLQDMESFFQMIDHQKLLQQAKELGFPIQMIRLALHLYSGPRHLTLGKGVATPVTPNRGIPPGCVWACTLVKVYYLRAFDAFVARHQQVLLDVFVEDIQCATHGEEEAVVDRLTEAIEDLDAVVKHEIHARLVPSKAACVASSARLARKLRAALGELAGSPVDVTEALGIDFAAARARREWAADSKQRKRVAAVSKRRARIRVITKFGSKAARKLTTQGSNPASLYGAAVTGISDGLLTQVRRNAACSTPLFAQGRSLDITLQLADLDPASMATAAPMIRWAQEIWQTTTAGETRAIPLNQLARAWQRSFTCKPTRWQQVRGPIGAAILSAKRLGWNVEHLTRWYKDQGETLELTKASPKLISWYALQTWNRIISKRVAGKLSEDGYSTDKTIDFSHVRHTLRSNAPDQLTPHEKNSFRNVTCGAIWTMDRLRGAGYQVELECPMCKTALDSIFHRLWQCPCNDALRSAFASQQLILEALHAGPTSATYNRGLCDDLAELTEAPPSEGGILFMLNGEEIQDPNERKLQGNIFYDGSCIKRGAPGIDRATWAAVQVDEEGAVVACVSGPVWRSLPQTARAAEHCARAAAVQLLVGPATLYGDSKNIVRLAQGPRDKACDPKRMHAAASRVAAESSGAQHVLADVWVKAHRSIKECTSDYDRFTCVGNTNADAAAVEAQTRLGFTGTPCWKQVLARQTKMRTICRLIGTVAATWPTAKRICGGSSRDAPPPRGAKLLTAPEHPHQWVHSEGRWTCQVCLTFAYTDQAKQQRCGEHCPGFCASLASALRHPRGHAFAAVDTEGAPLIICMRCGAWAATNPVNLMAQCPRAMRPGGKQAFRRLARGLHPSYYGNQPRVKAVIPFAWDEAHAQQLRDRAPAPRRTVPVPIGPAKVLSERTLASIARMRARLASSGATAACAGEGQQGGCKRAGGPLQRELPGGGATGLAAALAAQAPGAEAPQRQRETILRLLAAAAHEETAAGPAFASAASATGAHGTGGAAGATGGGAAAGSGALRGLGSPEAWRPHHDDGTCAMLGTAAGTDEAAVGGVTGGDERAEGLLAPTPEPAPAASPTPGPAPGPGWRASKLANGQSEALRRLLEAAAAPRCLDDAMTAPSATRSRLAPAPAPARAPAPALGFGPAPEAIHRSGAQHRSFGRAAAPVAGRSLPAHEPPPSHGERRDAVPRSVSGAVGGRAGGVRHRPRDAGRELQRAHGRPGPPESPLRSGRAGPQDSPRSAGRSHDHRGQSYGRDLQRAHDCDLPGGCDQDALPDPLVRGRSGPPESGRRRV